MDRPTRRRRCSATSRPATASRRSTTRPTCAATSRGGTTSSARSCPATRPPARRPACRPRSSSRTTRTRPRGTSRDTRWVRADEWYNFSTERPRQRPRAALDGRVDVRPGRQRHGLRPPDRVVQALRRRPRLGHRAGPLRRPLRRAAVPRTTSSAASSTRPASRPATAAARSTPTSRRSRSTTTRARRSPSTSRPTAACSSRSSSAARSASTTRQNGQRQDRAHARRLLRRRGRPARHHGRPGLRDQQLHLRLLRARSRRTTTTRPTGSAGSPASPSARTRTIDPASEKLIIEVPARPRRRRARPHRRRPRLRPARATCCSASATTSTRTPSPRAATPRSPSARPTRACTTRARRRPTRTTCAASCCASRRAAPTPRATRSPPGNLFPEAEDTEDKTRPEIYAMGFRNPFRFSVDPNTGWIGLADYAPDSGTDAPATRGPAGIVEWNLIKPPGNYGWPLCMGNSEPFRDVDYTTSPVTRRRFFDCANPVNDSVRNTGLHQPPAGAGAGHVLRLHEVVGPGRDPGRRRPRADGRPVLRLRPGRSTPTSSSRSTSTASRSSTSGRRTASTR